MSEISQIVRELENRLKMTDSDRVEQAGRNVAHLED